MPVTVDLKYEYLVFGWSGRVKLLEVLLAIVCMILCASPATEGTQTWFLLVVIFSFLGTIFLGLYHLCLDAYIAGSHAKWIQGEFWFTVAATFFYFTAWTAQMATYTGIEEKQYVVHASWYDAQVTAAVFALFNNIVYGVGTYLVYLEWRANPVVTTLTAVPPPPASA